MKPASETELAEVIARAKEPLRIIGGGTRQGLGNPVTGAVLETNGLSGISLYEPGALTLVAKAGTPLSEVEDALTAQGQRLPFEPMDHRGIFETKGTPTIGAVAACNISGPRRVQAGACRDYMLGVRFVDGLGNVVKNGGRVMKNVTGYDLVKLMAGSHGTLGVLSEVSFKVLPLPERSLTLTLHNVTGLNALQAMTRAMRSPYEVTGAAALREPEPAVHLRLEGFDGSVAYRTEKLKALLAEFGEISVSHGAPSDKRWQGIRDVAPLKHLPFLWRVSLRPDAMFTGLLAAFEQVLEHSVLLDWAGGLGWIGLSEEQAAQYNIDNHNGDADAIAGAKAFHQDLQSAASDPVISVGGGHATLVKAPSALRMSVPVFQPQAAALNAIEQGLRAKFDPKNLLNPGLMG